MSGATPKKQTLIGKIFQVLVMWTVYFLFRPKIIYADKTLKKRLKGKPVVFVANHTHHFDGAFGPAVMWRHKPYVLVKKSWFEKKGTGKCISLCRSIPIDLDAADGEWYEAAQYFVSKGFSLFIFPEGGLARNGRLNEFKPGAALLSAKTGIPIVPCAIYGRYDAVFGKRQKMLIGEPIESNCPKDMRPSKYARVLTAQSEQSVRELYSQMSEKYGSCGQYDD
ncbi:MAG: 1-acyl-sn-glycerol-3-phosphate acyltransferase [Oscillospiraceae bacterium]|nr:1-acyl-sn-glycerol-3-phosphate acyltransferase [Oscillospiraceae bacterium]